MQFGMKFFWEFIQNLPLVAGLILAIQLWQEGLMVTTLAAMITGSILGALLIRLTELRIIGGHQSGGLQEEQEPVAVTAMNAALMFLFMLILTVYLTAGWSSIATDLLAGSLIGLMLSAGQSLAAGRAVGWRHSLAFTAAFPASIITIRLLTAILPLFITILFITTIVTLIITVIDYGHLFTMKEGAS